MKTVRKIDSIAYMITKGAAVISGLLIALSTIIIFLYVINRSFIGQVWLFVEEWTSLALIPISYLGMAYTLRHNRHLYVDILMTRLKPKISRVIDVIIALFCIIVLAFMIERAMNWLEYTIVDRITSSGPMRTPLWIFTLTMAVGLIIYFVDMVLLFIKRVFLLFNKDPQMSFYD